MTRSSRQGAQAPTTGDTVALRAVERTVQTVRRLPATQGIAVVAVLLVTIWVVVGLTGGPRTALPHLFYLPIILSVALFGLRWSLLVVLAATAMAGPFMPGEVQPVLNWVLRGLMFLTVATAVSASITVRDALHRERTRRDLVRALDLRPVGLRVDDALVREVPRVLRERDFSIVYQPIVCLRHRRLYAVEALTRFTAAPHSTPDRWFAAAHAAGIGPELELAAMELSLERAATLPAEVPLAVNVSAETVTHPRLRRLLRDHDRRVVLELTEHDIIGNYQTLNESLDELRAMDVTLAVDDAGAGASSMRHIVQLRPDLIKLDMSLTRGVHRSTVLQTLGRSVLAFAHGTGSLLVVEGVEEEEDLQTWADIGADAAQGFFLGRPGPVGDVGSVWTGIPSQRPRPDLEG